MNLKLLTLILAFAMSLGCSVKEETHSSVELADGAYLLADVAMTEQGEVTRLQRAQMKIYAHDRYMFAFMHETLDKPDVGAGLTEWKDGVLIESPIFNQDGPLDSLHFSLNIQQVEGGFLQSIKGLVSNGHTYDMVETWDRLSGQSSAFDGLWKLQDRRDDDSDFSQFSEVKMIGGGHFIFSQSFIYEGETQQHFGFGEFSIDDAGVVTETGMASSFADFAGKEHTLIMELVDADHFNQTFRFSDRDVTQSYERQ